MRVVAHLTPENPIVVLILAVLSRDTIRATYLALACSPLCCKNF